MALGAERNGEARSHAATPDDDDVHTTVQHAGSGRAKLPVPNLCLPQSPIPTVEGDGRTRGTLQPMIY